MKKKSKPPDGLAPATPQTFPPRPFLRPLNHSQPFPPSESLHQKPFRSLPSCHPTI